MCRKLTLIYLNFSYNILIISIFYHCRLVYGGCIAAEYTTFLCFLYIFLLIIIINTIKYNILAKTQTLGNTGWYCCMMASQNYALCIHNHRITAALPCNIGGCAINTFSCQHMLLRCSKLQEDELPTLVNHSLLRGMRSPSIATCFYYCFQTVRVCFVMCVLLKKNVLKKITTLFIDQHKTAVYIAHTECIANNEYKHLKVYHYWIRHTDVH